MVGARAINHLRDRSHKKTLSSRSRSEKNNTESAFSSTRAIIWYWKLYFRYIIVWYIYIMVKRNIYNSDLY